jgi:vacuolar-type H+-ATPase subunit H
MNQLKDAEKRASQLVQEARKGTCFATMNLGWLRLHVLTGFICDIARVDRMKEAKTEAEQIIAAYRAEMEAAYQAKLSSVI